VARLGDDVVGMGELHIRNRKHGQGEISYVVHPRVWGRGIGTEIGRLLLAYGFAELGLHRIHATCDPRNTGSSRVLSKLGMTYEGHLRHTARIRDGWRDSLVFSVLEEEWGARAAAARA
jgi:[ribosomal protein S5]-alanine N-acetyltransferase